VETSFIFVFQGFLGGIGLIESTKLKLPTWYPRSFSISIFLLLCFGVCRTIGNVAKQYITSRTSQAFIRQQRSLIIEFGLRRAEELASHQIINTVTNKVSDASQVLQGISQLIQVGISACLIFFVGLRLAPQEMIVAIVLLSLMILPLPLFNSHINRYGTGLNIALENAMKTLVQGLQNNFFLKIYGLVSQEINKAKEELQLYEKNICAYYRIIALRNNFPSLAGIFCICAVAFISTKYFHTSSIVLISFFYLFIRLGQSAGEIGSALSELRLCMPGFKEVYRWYEMKTFDDAKLEIPSEIAKSEFDRGISIKFQEVQFCYPDSQPIISNFNLEVQAGEFLLIKGPSGTGKSTLLMLSIGLLKPSSGNVFINGHESFKASSKLFERIAYVGPTPYMIQGTIKENLLFGHHSPEKVTEQEMLDALKQSKILKPRISLDLFVNEQTQLSTGEKQRISIARALLRKPALLILDEATGNLDAETERIIIQSLATITRAITTIVVSHKPSFDSLATQTLEMGQIQLANPLDSLVQT
jgi:ATP-binding cassette subfamily B protein